MQHISKMPQNPQAIRKFCSHWSKNSTSTTGPVGQVKSVRTCSPEPIYSFFFSLKLLPNTSFITNRTLQARNHRTVTMSSFKGVMTQQLPNSVHKKALRQWVGWERTSTNSPMEVLELLIFVWFLRNWTWNNRLVPNRKRSMSRLYIVTLLI